jgi:glycosyl transferase family 25
MMQILVLNLATATKRMEFQQQQLDALGLEFQRLDAITPETLSPPADHSYWLGWERPLADIEKAILLTHCRAWDKVVSDNKPYLILEDDALLSSELSLFLSSAENLKNIDHISLEVRARKKLLGKRFHPQLNIRRLYQDRTGAAAYILWPKGAQKLLQTCRNRPGLADGIICAAYNMVSYQADPALVIQLDQCKHYGFDRNEDGSTLNTSSRKDMEVDLSRFKYLNFRFRRIYSQVRMGLRMFRYILISDRIEPTLVSFDKSI